MSKVYVSESMSPVSIQVDELGKCVQIVVEDEKLCFYSPEEVVEFCVELVEAACVTWKDSEFVKQNLS